MNWFTDNVFSNDEKKPRSDTNSNTSEVKQREGKIHIMKTIPPSATKQKRRMKII
jgi:stalled ribosome rescue protein Dom34